MSCPWMPFYVATYIADTGHLSTLEHGAYMLLIMHYWQKGGLPDDDAQLARICRMPASDWSAIRDTIAAFFDGKWHHKRIASELAKAEQVISKRSAAGKAGASARYSKRTGEVSQADAPLHTQEEDSSSRSEDAPSSDRLVEKVSRVEVSPSDPVLARPDDPLAAYSEGELKALAFEFDGLDIESELCELTRWADRRDIPELDRKSAIYGALKKRHAKAKLHDAVQGDKPQAQASPQLANSKLVQRAARTPAHAARWMEDDLPKGLDHRKTPQEGRAA